MAASRARIEALAGADAAVLLRRRACPRGGSREGDRRLPHEPHARRARDAPEIRLRHHERAPPAARAQLSKLLIYDAGCFFAPHRDSEKLDGMFALPVAGEVLERAR